MYIEFVQDIFDKLNVTAVNLRVEEDPFCAEMKKKYRGVWEKEPDQVTWFNPELNLVYVAKRHSRMGHWCGYIGIPDSHSLVSKTEMYFELHGGVTYDKPELNFYEPVEGEPPIVRWVGFDCSHVGDYNPFMGYRILDQETYRNLEYVITNLVEGNSLPLSSTNTRFMDTYVIKYKESNGDKLYYQKCIGTEVVWTKTLGDAFEFTDKGDAKWFAHFIEGLFGIIVEVV